MASTTNKTVYVVTGGNRGLGLGLVKALLARPDTTVVATVRSQEAANTLKESTVDNSNGDLRIIQLDFSRAIPAEDVRSAVEKDAGVDHVDVLILNAGGAQPMVPATETTAEDLRAAFEVNTIAPLLVFQGLWPLLQKTASKTPKLIWITSSVGSITEMEPVPGGAYGPSRAAQNWLTKALHQENGEKGLVAIALHPGWVQTRAGQFVADQWGFSRGPPDTIESSVEGMLKVIDTASKETSGKFLTQKGEVLGW